MTVSELISQVQALITAGVIDASTLVLADGCDCVGAALAVVAIQRKPRDVDTGDGKERVVHLLVSREDGGRGDRPDGIRVADL